MKDTIKNSIAPWFEVANIEAAINFYKAAFNATEIYSLKDDDGHILVARLLIFGSEFWVSSNTNLKENKEHNIRMILTNHQPDVVFEQAIKAGASIVFPVGEEHGWRLGRLSDPFGLDWEIGYEI